MSYRALYRIAWPILLSNELATLTTLIALFWMGRLAGTEGLGVFSLMNPVELIVAWLMGAISTGNGALVAQSVGARDGRGLKLTVNALAATLIAALLLVIPGLLFSDQIAEWLAKDLDLEVRSYLLFWLIVAVPALSLTEVMLDAFNATGWTRLGLVRVIADLCLVAILTPIAMRVFGLGVGGPPLAAGVSGFLLFFAMSITMLRTKDRLALGDLRTGEPLIEPRLWTKLFAVGFAPQIARVATFAAQLILVRRAASGGEIAVAGYGLAFNVLLFAAMITLALAQANAIQIGQSLGAKAPDRALASMKSAAVLALFLVIAMFFAIPHLRPLIELFVEDAAVVDDAMRALGIMRFGVIGVCGFQLLISAYTATMKNQLAGIAMIACEAIGVGFALISKGPPLETVALAFTLANCLKALSLLALLKHGFLEPVESIR